VAAGDSLHAAGAAAPALAIWEELLTRERNPEILWRAARECVVLGMWEEEAEGREAWFRRGEGFAREALELRPHGLQERYWLLANLGQRALRSRLVTTARLAEEIHREVHLLLEADPRHPGGHHVLGVLNSEVMKFPGITRFLGRSVLGGGDLYDTSWEEAERHLSLAVELDPHTLLYRLDLGILQQRTGRREEAAETFAALLALPEAGPVDPVIRKRAGVLLRELER